MKLSRQDFLRSSLLAAAGAMFNVVGCALDAGESLPRGKRSTDLEGDDPDTGSGYGGSGSGKSTGSGGSSGKGGSYNTSSGGSSGSGSTSSKGGSGGTGGSDDPGYGSGDPDGNAGAGTNGGTGGGGGKGGGTSSGGSTNTAGTGGASTGSCSRVVSTIGSNHGHVLVVAASDVTAGRERTYDITGTSSHPHKVVVTSEHFAALKAGEDVVIESDGAGHTHSVQLRCG